MELALYQKKMFTNFQQILPEKYIFLVKSAIKRHTVYMYIAMLDLCKVTGAIFWKEYKFILNFKSFFQLSTFIFNYR